MGDEPIHSQGHVHKPTLGTAMPEIFEIWQGTAIIYMQERVEQEPGRCFAVTARPPEIVVCPPGWGYMVVNGDTQSHMVFGAVCDRSHSSFAYENVKKHKGMAYYPKISGQNTLYWEKNPEYLPSPFIEKTPEKYWFSDILDDGRLYTAITRQPEAFGWIHDARLAKKHFGECFVP